MATNMETEKTITARQLKRKLRFLNTQIHKQELHVIKLHDVGTMQEWEDARLHRAKLYGMQEAYESLLQSLEDC